MMKIITRISQQLATAAAVLSLCALLVTPVHAQGPVSADGAYGTNAAWEAGQSPYWYPELQRYGTDYIEAGIAQENPILISQGLLILDWGFNKEAADGSFPGCSSVPINATNAKQATGNVFHTTSLFFEGASRATLELRAYHPVTYTLDPNTYAAKLAEYATKLEATAQWLTNTNWTPPGASTAVSVAALGMQYDQAFTHRFALLSAGLQECSDVTGDTSLITKPYGVNAWIDQYFPRQLGTGYMAAIPALAFTKPTPAVILAPGVPTPLGTAEMISAHGVLPERGGYDVSYHMVDCLHATRWYNASTDAARKAQLVPILTNALQWERSRESVDGVIDFTGSSRVGIDPTQNGLGIKTISTGEVEAAFAAGGVIDHKGRDILGGIRFAASGVLPNSDPIDSQGAIGSNINYDTHASSSYDIAYQKDCADWVQQGIRLENDAQIQQGLTILQWGLARQAQDGSFPLTGSRFTDTAAFIEAAARTVLMLENYHPISHPLNMSLLAGISADIAAINKSAAYLTNPALILGGYVSTTSASKIFTYAAAFGEAAVLTHAANPAGSAAYQTLANSYLFKALALQLPDGTDGEGGSLQSQFPGGQHRRGRASLPVRHAGCAHEDALGIVGECGPDERGDGGERGRDVHLSVACEGGDPGSVPERGGGDGQSGVPGHLRASQHDTSHGTGIAKTRATYSHKLTPCLRQKRPGRTLPGLALCWDLV